MTDDQHGEGTPRSPGRWDPLPQGDYDDGATAFVKLPEGGVDALLASADTPLAAPGHGYVPPQITSNPAGPAGADPAGPDSWAMPAAPPAESTQWPDPNAVPQGSGGDRFTYDPVATGHWNFEDTTAADSAQAAPAPGHDVTGQWSIPVAGGELPDESGEFTTSSLVEQWGGTPPATLPGGAPAPWATEPTGQPWGQPPGTAEQTPAAGPAAGHGPEAPTGTEHGYDRPTGPGYDRPDGSEFAHGRPTDGGPGPQRAEEFDGAPGQEASAFEGAPGQEGAAFGGVPGQAEAHGAVPPLAHPGERHAPDRHAPRPPGPEGYPGERPATDAHAPLPTGGDAHAPVEPRPAGAEREQSGPQGAEQPQAPASEHPRPLPPEQPPAEARAEASAAAVVEASQAAHEAGEAMEAAEHPEAAAKGEETAVAAAEGAGEAGAEAETTEPAADGPESADPAPPAMPGEEHPLASYVLRVNGVDRPVTDAWIGESLLYVLRERLGLAGAKDGCSQGECGACNVQVDGRLVASCLVPAVTAAGSEVRTVEGLAVDGQPSDVQRALARCGAVQCGFCVPGMAMTVHDLLEGNPAPTERETRQALCGNLCRCSGYRGVVDAVQEVVAEREAHSAADAETDGDEARIPHQAGPGAGGVNPSAFEPARPHDQAYGNGSGNGPGQDGGQA
ncbi:2Fe-2S iron-sulfur cluster-binding protein [Streptomyces sp. NPDC001658]